MLTPGYQSHINPVNDIHLHHLEWAGDEPPVIFLPGFISNALAALRLGAALAPARRVLALDLRGRGRSDKPEEGYSLGQHVADVLSWKAAQGIGRCVLAGHSFGAALALFIAQQPQAQVEKLILFDGGAVPSPVAHQLSRAYHENLRYLYPSVEDYVSNYRDLPTMQPWTEEAESLLRSNVEVLADGQARRSVPPHVVAALLQALEEQDFQQLATLYPRTACPVLLIRAGYGSFGREDQHIPDEVLAQMNFPNLRVYTMPSTGHTGILTVPDAERDTILRDFLLSS